MTRPVQASPEQLETLGYPSGLAPDWKSRLVQELDKAVRGNRALGLFLDACTHCGACADKCPFFLGTGDFGNMPVARQDLMRRIYRRHFTLAGQLAPKLVGAADMDEGLLDQWFSYFHQCSQCRRCAVFCPQGIDTAEVTMAARAIMARIGLGQAYTAQVLSNVHRTGNGLGMGRAALIDTLACLEEDMAEQWGAPIRLPVDQMGAEVLLVTSSADLYGEPHVASLMGYAKVFHAAGISWTLSSAGSEAGNFGLFLGDDGHMRTLAGRIVQAARDLGVKQVVFGECGHAWRVAQSLLPELGIRPRHMLELTLEVLERGALRLDPDANAGVTATFHDSCNMARGGSLGNTPDGVFAIPRRLLAASVPKLVEMPAGATRGQTFCCGGGGGLLTDELMDIRKAGARPRLEALAQATQEHAITHMVAICAICKSQFGSVLPKGVVVAGVHELLGNALVL